MAQLPDLFRNNRTLFNEFFNGLDTLFSPPEWSNNDMNQFIQPNFDIEERGDNYVLSVEVPGVKQTDLKIDCTGRVLTISGERRESKGSENSKNFSRRYGRFSRSFTLPEGIEAKDVQAHYEDGLLEIVVPRKAALGASQSIQVQSGRAHASSDSKTEEKSNKSH